MKKIIIFTLSVVLLSSCMTIKPIPKLIGAYNVTTIMETDKTFDEVWNKVIDYFTYNGIPIVTLEKASGVIISNKVILKGELVTMEKDGVPLDENAYVVIPYAKNIVYKKTTSDFNVRVKEVNGKVVISVNLPNIIAERTTKPTGFKMISVPEPVEAKSTGVFERGLLNLFK